MQKIAQPAAAVQCEPLSADGTYAALFEKAFGPGLVILETTAKAIAAFERTILSGNSAFDRYFYGGDQSALSEGAKLGLEVFRDPKRGNCAACHSFNEDYALFSDDQFHNSGVAVGPDGELVDLGRFFGN
jgi:cytochrome c peroxidase